MSEKGGWEERRARREVWEIVDEAQIRRHKFCGSEEEFVSLVSVAVKPWLPSTGVLQSELLD